MSERYPLSGEAETYVREIMGDSVHVLLSWSGGKDSSLALADLQADPRFVVDGLLTTITRDYDRISIHGVRRELLLEQVKLTGLPLWEVSIVANADNSDYQAAFLNGLATVRKEAPNITHVAFGDLFLADVREYRERLLANTGLTPLFPLWNLDTTALAHRFVDDGYRANIVCVDTTQLDAGFAGRQFDRSLLNDLPGDVDPCGERGEFHTFVSAGPCLAGTVKCVIGAVVLRDERFAYCDIDQLSRQPCSSPH